MPFKDVRIKRFLPLCLSNYFILVQFAELQFNEVVVHFSLKIINLCIINQGEKERFHFSKFVFMINWSQLPESTKAVMVLTSVNYFSFFFAIYIGERMT